MAKPHDAHQADAHPGPYLAQGVTMHRGGLAVRNQVRSAHERTSTGYRLPRLDHGGRRVDALDVLVG